MTGRKMTSKTGRIFYFDALRVLAILFVISLHATGHLAEIFPFSIDNIYTFRGFFASFAPNFLRIGVDLFLMLSGALLLGREWTYAGFLKKRLPRLVKPFIFWSLIFTVMLVLASYLMPGLNFIAHFTVTDILMLFWDTITCRAPGSVVYWFFWMMLGVYLMIPLFNRWIVKTDFRKIEYFLILWTVYIFFAYTMMLPIPYPILFFFTPMGFVVLGYYLRYTERKIFKNTLLMWCLVIIPSALMVMYAYALVDIDLLFIFERYSIPVMLVAAGVFSLFKNSKRLDNIPEKFKSVISSIAICSYGMYLTHGQIMMVIRKIIPMPANYPMDFIILFIGGFFLSWIVIFIMAKIPLIKD